MFFSGECFICLGACFYGEKLMEVLYMKKNRTCVVLLSIFVLFIAAPSMAAWVSTDITGLGGTVNQIPQAKMQTPATVVSTDFKPGYDLSVPAAVASDGTAVYVTAATVQNYFASRGETYTQKQELPLYKVLSTAESLDVSPDVLVMHPLSTFSGKTPADLNVVKVTGSNAFHSFSGVYTAAGIANRRFAVISTDKKSVMGASDVIATGCFIALCVNSADIVFNVGSGDIIDPAFVYTTAMLVPVTGVSISPTQKVIAPGATYTFTATVSPDTATNKNVTWSSNNTTIATVSSSGVVTGGSNGTTTITATTQDGGFTASATVIVGVPVTRVTVDPTSATIGVGGIVDLDETVEPSTAANKNVTWSSSNTSIATVSETGVVTGRAAGTATITVTTADGGKTATSIITVVSGPQPVTPGFQLPSGVENPSSIIVPGTVAESGLNPAAGDTVEQMQVSSSSSSSTYLVLKNQVVSNILAYRGNSMNSQIAIKMPVFKATVSATGKTGVVMFPLSTSSLAGYKAGNVLPVKAISTSASEARYFTFVDSPSKLADGKFGIVKADKATFMGSEEVIQSGYTYYIVFTIKDGGPFDMNISDMYISDPTFVGLSTGHRSSGGGCSTGAFAPAALLLALPLCAVFFNRRR